MMIDTIATRRITHEGVTYEKGAKVTMPLQQFNDLEPTGVVERAPAASSKVARKARAKAAPRKQASAPLVSEAPGQAPDSQPASQAGAEKAD